MSLIGLGQIAWASGSQVNRLKGDWVGTYANKRKTAEFRLTIKENGLALYRDSSALGPYCEGQVKKDTSRSVDIAFKCSTKKQRKSGNYKKNTSFTLIIKNPDNISNAIGKQSAVIYSSIVGSEKVYIYKLANELFSDVLSSPEDFEGSLILPQYGTKNTLFGNLHFKLQENNQLIVTSGYLKSTKGHWSEVNYRNVFGDEGYLSGSYKITGKKITLKIKDDGGTSVSITMNWINILNKNIYNYNVDLPKYIEIKSVTDVVIDGEKFKAGIRGPGFTAR